jgi:hypothetical protein
VTPKTITITHLGAETCVTGSCHLVQFQPDHGSGIAGSGMCTGGRIVSHLKHDLDDPKNDLFFVGYKAQGTSTGDMVKFS